MDIESNITNTYRTKDIAELLKISDSSIRKYAIAMVAAGAAFNHDEKGDRLYDERDYKAFSLMRQQISTGYTMKEAAVQAAALLVNERQARREAGEVLIRSDREVMLTTANGVGKLLDENERLHELLAKQDADRRAQEARHRKETAELRQELAEVKQQNEEILEMMKRWEQDANDARTAGAAGNTEKSLPETEKTPEPKGRGLLSWFSRKK